MGNGLTSDAKPSGPTTTVEMLSEKPSVTASESADGHAQHLADNLAVSSSNFHKRASRMSEAHWKRVTERCSDANAGPTMTFFHGVRNHWYRK